MAGEEVTILLVEDDDVDAQNVRRAFKKNKIANPVVRAVDGIEALEMMRGENGHAGIKPPFIMLVDINMPRMNGIEFLQKVRKDPALRRTIAFVLTTSERDEDRIGAYDLNVAGYLVKSDAGAGFMDMVSMLDHYWKIIEFPPH